MRRLTSILLVTTLLLGIAPFLSSYSQPNKCININNIKTPQLVAQFETWLNEPNGLNARFLDNTESSFERGQRLFYDLVLSRNQICLSDLTQEMIDSITEIIRSYNNAIDHSYLVNSLTVSRSQINLGFKSIRDPIILEQKSIFAQAIQIAVPIDDVDSLISGWLLPGGFACSIVSCFQILDEFPPDDTVIGNTSPVSTENYVGNLTVLTDPNTDLNHFFNFSAHKSASGGRQIDFNITLAQGTSSIIQTEIILNINEVPLILLNVSITQTNASLITDYSNLVLFMNANEVGGGAGRSGHFDMFRLGVPDAPIDDTPVIVNLELFGLFNSTDRTYSILSFDGRDKVFQDQQVRLNATITDLNGRNNMTELQLRFNGTTIVLIWRNVSGIFIFSTTTPLIVENLEGLVDDTIVNGFNITFTFSLSSQLSNGYYSLDNATVTDSNTSGTDSIFRWFSFIGIGAGGGGVSQLSLAPIGPQIMLAFILVGLLALGQSNPWFVLGGWVSMAMAFGMSLTGQIYIGLGATENLLTFSQAFPEDFSVWIFRFFIIMQFIYPIRIFVLVWERLIKLVTSLRNRFG